MGVSERRRPSRWWRDFWRLAKPFWVSEKRWIAILFTTGITIQAIAAVYYNVLINRNNGALMNSIANRSADDFYRAIWDYVWIGAAWIGVGRAGRYLRYRLKLMWREWMTRRFLELWLKNQRHYFWNLTQKKDSDNPDQRISEDIGIFINTTEDLTLNLFETLLTAVTYGAILWSLSGIISVSLGSLSISIPGYLFWLCIGFCHHLQLLVVLDGETPDCP